MRMHAGEMARAVLEYDANLIANLSANQRPEHAQMPPMTRPHLEPLERRIGVFAINRFPITHADPIRHHRARQIIAVAAEQFLQHIPLRRVIPFDFFGGDVIRSHLAAQRHRRTVRGRGRELRRKGPRRGIFLQHLRLRRDRLPREIAGAGDQFLQLLFHLDCGGLPPLIRSKFFNRLQRALICFSRLIVTPGLH